MFAKLTLAILLAACIGAALLTLRQRRLALVHEMVVLHQQINADRQATWDYQVRIHEQLDPPRLREAIEQQQLELVPILAEPVNLPPPVTGHAHARP